MKVIGFTISSLILVASLNFANADLVIQNGSLFSVNPETSEMKAVWYQDKSGKKTLKSEGVTIISSNLFSKGDYLFSVKTKTAQLQPVFSGYHYVKSYEVKVNP